MKIEIAVNADLTILAQQINKTNQMVEASKNEAIFHAIECGAALKEAKLLVKHGEWGSWIKNNCDMSGRTVQAYMKLANEYPFLEDSNTQRVADLSIREALKLLSAPKDVEQIIADWLPKGDTLAVVSLEGTPYGETLYLQESSVNPGFYYSAYISSGAIDFLMRPIRSDHIERVISDWLPGKYMHDGVKGLEWEFLDGKADYVKNEVIEAHLPESHNHLRRKAA